MCLLYCACQCFWNCYKTLTFCSLLVGYRIPCACHKTTLQRPKVARTCSVFSMFTSKCGSRHDGVHFFDIWSSKSAPKLRRFAYFDFEICFAPQRRALFIFHLTRWHRTCRFSELTFWPSGATQHWNNIVFRDFSTFSRTLILCFLTLSLFLWSSLFFSSLLFSSLLFPSLLWLFPFCLFICPYCRNFDF